MKEISQKTKEKVVQLFLEADTYDEIAWKLGIAKGSVVNIIDEFREGDLVLSGDITDYVDELRRIAVYLKKRDITVGQMGVFLSLHEKLKDYLEDEELIEDWLDSIHEIIDSMYGYNDPVPASMESTMLPQEPKRPIVTRKEV